MDSEISACKVSARLRPIYRVSYGLLVCRIIDIVLAIYCFEDAETARDLRTVVCHEEGQRADVELLTVFGISSGNHYRSYVREGKLAVGQRRARNGIIEVFAYSGVRNLIELVLAAVYELERAPRNVDGRSAACIDNFKQNVRIALIRRHTHIELDGV